jgi:glycosyltransferase involved in cell wall biosynthesis
MNPKVSVLMPIYNGERHLRRTLDSVLQQSFPDFEVIVVNDCSPDNSRDVVLSYDDQRIRLIDNTKNLGQTGSLQVALDNARGEYIARQDQDDISLPDRFAAQVVFLDQHPEVGVLGTSYCVIDDHDRVLDGTAAFYPPETLAEMAWRFLWGDRLVDSSVMFRRDGAERIAGYNPDYRYAQDYDLWMRLSFETGVARLPEVLLQLRIHSASASSQFTEAQEREVHSIIREALNRLSDTPFSIETAALVRKVDIQLQPRKDVLQTANIIRKTYHAFIRERRLSRKDLASVKRAVAEKLVKIAISHRSTLRLETIRLLVWALSVYPVLPLQPVTLICWWRQRQQSRRYRQLVTALWMD